MPNRLNILFVTSWYPNDRAPISALFVKEHAKAAALHNNVVVLSMGDKSPTVKGLFDVDVKDEDGIKTIRLTHKDFKILKITAVLSIFSSLFYMFKIKKDGFKPDIIHANIFQAGVPSVLFGKLTHTKTIITEHWSGFARNLLSKLEIIKAKFVFNNADMILPVSDALKLSIEKYGISGEFRIVPNVIDIDLFKPAPSYDISTDNELNSRASNKDMIDNGNVGKGNAVKLILMVAEQLPVKGIPDALKAIKEIKAKRNDFILNIFGDGENKAEYEQLSVSYGLKDCVKFHGAQPKTMVASFMRHSSFLLLTSHYETFGCVAVEAMASGIPIVASCVGGISSLVPENAGILVEPGNASMLVSAIEFMLDNSDSYKKNEISKYVRSRFSTEMIGKELNSIYHEVLGSE
jgi:glycosyltransferase involved in cell wall biosynthesis